MFIILMEKLKAEGEQSKQQGSDSREGDIDDAPLFSEEEYANTAEEATTPAFMVQ